MMTFTRGALKKKSGILKQNWGKWGMDCLPASIYTSTTKNVESCQFWTSRVNSMAFPGRHGGLRAKLDVAWQMSVEVTQFKKIKK